MAFFDLFRSSGIDEGLRQFENTSGAALLDVRTPRSTPRDICREAGTSLWTRSGRPQRPSRT